MGKVKIRAITEAERQELQAGMRAARGSVVRRSQALLLSATEGLNPRQIAARVGIGDESIRRLIHRFNAMGIAVIYPRSSARPDDQRAFKDEARERLQALVRRSPREFGHESSLWTLTLLAEVSYAEGLTERLVHPDTVNETLAQMGISWKKAKRYLQSPDEQYVPKKNAATG